MTNSESLFFNLWFETMRSKTNVTPLVWKLSEEGQDNQFMKKSWQVISPSWEGLPSQNHLSSNTFLRSNWKHKLWAVGTLEKGRCCSNRPSWSLHPHDGHICYFSSITLYARLGRGVLLMLVQNVSAQADTLSLAVAWWCNDTMAPSVVEAFWERPTS